MDTVVFHQPYPNIQIVMDSNFQNEMQVYVPGVLSYSIQC